MQQRGSKYFSRRSPPPTVGIGSVGQNSTVSEHGHGASQFQETHKCSNMVANILPADPPPSLEYWVSRSKFNFLEHGHVAYQIKENHEGRNMETNILPTDSLLPRP